MPESRESPKDHTAHNRQQIHAYITIIRATLERQTGGGVLNMQEMSNKPESEPPLTDRALRLAVHPDNRRTARILDPLISELATTKGAYHFIIRRAIDDPTGPDRWRKQDTEDDAAQDSLYRAALGTLVSRVAGLYPGTRLDVAYDPDDEPAASRTEARHRARRHTAEDAYRDLSDLVDKRIQRGVPTEQAIEEVAGESEVSIRKVKYARAFVREETEAAS